MAGFSIGGGLSKGNGLSRGGGFSGGSGFSPSPSPFVPGGGNALLLNDGGYLLLEQGGHLLLAFQGTGPSNGIIQEGGLTDFIMLEDLTSYLLQEA